MKSIKLSELHKIYKKQLTDDEADWIDEMMFMQLSEMQAMADYIGKMQKHFVYLYLAQSQEEFELAALILERINSDEKSFIELAKYTYWFNAKIKMEDVLAIKEQFQANHLNITIDEQKQN